ncbi:hypothetical protein QCA50_019287 [Cerrena zonata]|uniref:Metallo-beta-lactamase domain-containing protein n=1 Tax=Cerrena zonata TaxID=2478898 RepID=A0AAW0FF92_9APHY
MSDSKTQRNGSSFVNPWSSGFSLRQSAEAILKGPLTRSTPFKVDVEPVKTVECDLEVYESEEAKEGVCATWLGHAGFLVQISGHVRIIFDPIFSERASPSTWIGPRRWLAPPCEPYELPEVHFIAISHNHYDHLDIQTLKDIHKRSPSAHFLVPLGVKALLVDELRLPDDQVTEKQWWESISFDIDNTQVNFICTPAQHNSGRGLLDQNHALWCSWVARCSTSTPNVDKEHSGLSLLSLRRMTANIYHAGDTGYTTPSGPCPAFSAIGKRYGPFDLAMVPIWRGASLSILGQMGYRLTAEATHTFLSTLHASPRDAVSLARDVRAQHTLGMHFGTFCGSEDESKEPLVELLDALEADHSRITGSESNGRKSTNLRESWKEMGGFGIIDVGQTITIKSK